MSESVRVSENKSEAAKEDRTSQVQKFNYSQPVNSSVDRILFLQKTIGNQAVGSLIRSGAMQIPGISETKDTRISESTHAAPEVSKLNQVLRTKPTSMGRLTQVEHDRQSFSATIRRIDKPLSSGAGSHIASGERSAINPRFAVRYNDAMPGNEETSVMDFESLLAQTAVTPADSISEPQDGETVQLPDIALDPSIRETDAIAGTLAYAPTITQSGPAPSPFGETLPYTFTMSGITVTRAPSTFTVTATVDNPITFQVASGGRTDISSDTDGGHHSS